jgi:hypothetical protein
MAFRGVCPTLVSLLLLVYLSSFLFSPHVPPARSRAPPIEIESLSSKKGKEKEKGEKKGGKAELRSRENGEIPETACFLGLALPESRPRANNEFWMGMTPLTRCPENRITERCDTVRLSKTVKVQRGHMQTALSMNKFQ